MCPFGFESNDAEEQITHKINYPLNDTRLSLCAQFKNPKTRGSWEQNKDQVCVKKKRNRNASVHAIIKSCIKKLFTAAGRNEEEVITRPENIYWLAQVEDFL